MFGLTKHCSICGIDVNKDSLKRFGKYFCNIEHAEQYAKKREEQRSMEEKKEHERRRGCC